MKFTTHEELELTIEVLSYRPGVDAQISGPPEYCHEGKPAEIEIAVSYNGHYMNDLLDPDLLEALELEALERLEAE